MTMLSLNNACARTGMANWRQAGETMPVAMTMPKYAVDIPASPSARIARIEFPDGAGRLLRRNGRGVDRHGSRTMAVGNMIADRRLIVGNGAVYHGMAHAYTGRRTKGGIADERPVQRDLGPAGIDSGRVGGDQ